MLEIGIPVYKALDTLPKALDSLVAQTKNNFIVCLSIDGDGNENTYKEMVQEYIHRGLKMRIINSKKNEGPGIARQRILDTTQCDYIMFLDADDMLMPRAVEVLYEQAKREDYDIVRSSFIREEKNKNDYILPQNMSVITWFHGKIYKVAFLKKKNINFLTGLRIDEDAYFNLIAWNSAEKRGELEETTYIWRYNKNSLTRAQGERDYFSDTYMCYIISQVEGLKKLYEINGQITDDLISQTLLNIYYYYMKARFYGLDEMVMNNKISELRSEQWMQEYLNNGQNWVYIIQNVKAGEFYENSSVVFFNEPFNFWAKRLLKAEDAPV